MSSADKNSEAAALPETVRSRRQPLKRKLPSAGWLARLPVQEPKTPPLMSSVAPVTNPSPSLARKATARATSAGVPARPSGIPATVATADSGGRVRVMECSAENQTRRHGVDPAAAGSKFFGQRTGPGDYRALGRRVGQCASVTSHSPGERRARGGEQRRCRPATPPGSPGTDYTIGGIRAACESAV